MGFDTSTPDLPAIMKPLPQIYANDPRALFALEAMRRRLAQKRGRAGTILYDSTQAHAQAAQPATQVPQSASFGRRHDLNGLGWGMGQ